MLTDNTKAMLHFPSLQLGTHEQSSPHTPSAQHLVMKQRNFRADSVPLCSIPHGYRTISSMNVETKARLDVATNVCTSKMLVAMDTSDMSRLNISFHFPFEWSRKLIENFNFIRMKNVCSKLFELWIALEIIIYLQQYLPISQIVRYKLLSFYEIFEFLLFGMRVFGQLRVSPERSSGSSPSLLDLHSHQLFFTSQWTNCPEFSLVSILVFIFIKWLIFTIKNHNRLCLGHKNKKNRLVLLHGNANLWSMIWWMIRKYAKLNGRL